MADTTGGLRLDLIASDYLAAVRAAERDPRRLEELYGQARRGGDTARFAEALDTAHATAPENLLFAAWHYRLHAPAERPALHWANWRVAIPLSVALGAALWAISDLHWTLARGVPYILALAGPVVAASLIAYLALSSRARLARALAAVLVLGAVTAYALTLGRSLAPTSNNTNTYLTQLVLHLPLVAWAAVGVAALGARFSPRDGFGFLAKSLEVAATAGVAAIAGGMFVGLTYGLFAALGVTLPDVVVRLLVFGGGGLIPVMTVAAVYDPSRPPGAQEFRRGLGRIVPILTRALLPLSLIVLVVYLGFIPFNFSQPFVNRDVLIVYNALLFAVLGLLVGVIPVSPDDVPPRLAGPLRAGIVALAALVVLISLYALAAVLYRTAQSSLTLNRAVVIGWNVVNIGILVLLLARQLWAGRAGWVDALHATARVGMALYVVWGLVVALALPWFFGA